jgi:hypothetical protein
MNYQFRTSCPLDGAAFDLKAVGDDSKESADQEKGDVQINYALRNAIAQRNLENALEMIGGPQPIRIGGRWTKNVAISLVVRSLSLAETPTRYESENDRLAA